MYPTFWHPKLVRGMCSSFYNRRLVDVLCFLMSNMTEDVEKDFLKCDLTTKQYSRVLLHLIYYKYSDEFLKTFTSMWDFLPLDEFDDSLFHISICFGKGNMFKEIWNQSPVHFRQHALNDGQFIHALLMDVMCHDEIKRIIMIFSSEERFSVVFSKFIPNNYESGLFLIAFAAGHLDLAQWLAKSCALSETDLKHLLKKELDYFANQLNFKVGTKREFVYDRYYQVYGFEGFYWLEDRWEEVQRMLASVTGLQ